MSSFVERNEYVPAIERVMTSPAPADVGDTVISNVDGFSEVPAVQYTVSHPPVNTIVASKSTSVT